MNIRQPSTALQKRIVAAGDDLRLRVFGALGEGDMAEVRRLDGSELSEPEQRRVAGLIAADDADPFI